MALARETVFSLTGGMAMHMNRAVAQHGVLKPVYCQHEQACVAAAEGYAKIVYGVDVETVVGAIALFEHTIHPVTQAELGLRARRFRTGLGSH